ncbi:MAG: hypothetical protein QOF02_1457 [Blastocatellia bacterium]|jgi:hypothetical protein|nr:hypothetical protein [Blastocatellia bacterium]
MQSAAKQPEHFLSPLAEQESAGRDCPACGTTARREAARFCATCGRDLNGSYLPADALRSSYYMQQQRPGRRAKQSARPQVLMTERALRDESTQQQMPKAATINNSASSTALAFVTYSLVPYLGILFCPGAIVMGGLGLLRFRRVPQRGGRRASYLSIILGFVILCAQIFLWWILYKVPQWASQL